MGLLVGAMDIATANNTVAIVMANPIAARHGRDLRHLEAQDGVHPGHVLLRVPGQSSPTAPRCSWPYRPAAELGYAVSAFQIMPFLFYPFLLLASSLVFIFFVPDDRGYVPDHAAARMEATVGAAEGAAGDK